MSKIKNYIKINFGMLCDAFIISLPLTAFLVFFYMAIDSGDGKFYVDMNAFNEYWLEVSFFPTWLIMFCIRRKTIRRAMNEIGRTYWENKRMVEAQET